VNSIDTIEKLIHEESVRIEAIDFHPELDVMLIILNTKAVLRQKISAHKSLANANLHSLQQYEFIGNGVGVHWPLLDEDLSLKGFLADELRSFIKKDNSSLAA